ncbi:hypothetical protein G6F65_022213 [Rhizopus arrhizus]|nr:hypothetical protein G6F65_022213 [Rhizopus arrhizus]
MNHPPIKGVIGVLATATPRGLFERRDLFGADPLYPDAGLEGTVALSGRLQARCSPDSPWLAVRVGFLENRRLSLGFLLQDTTAGGYRAAPDPLLQAVVEFFKGRAHFPKARHLHPIDHR